MRDNIIWQLLLLLIIAIGTSFHPRKEAKGPAWPKYLRYAAIAGLIMMIVIQLVFMFKSQPLPQIIFVVPIFVMLIVSAVVRLSYPKLYVVFCSLAVIMIFLNFSWSNLFPPRLNNEPLRSAIQEYIGSGISSSRDLGISGDIRDLRISEVILHKDRPEGNIGLAVASVLGNYSTGESAGQAQATEFKLKLQLGYMLQEDSYLITYHEAASRFIFEP